MKLMRLDVIAEQALVGAMMSVEQTLNQLLVEMDGFEANEGIILIAATNRADVPGSSLAASGLFDRQIQVPNPILLVAKRS